MTWTTLRVRTDGARDAVLAALFAAGAQGVHEDGDALVTSFPPAIDVNAVQVSILAADASALIETSPLDDVNWSEQWKTRIHAHRLGDLVISPPWLADEYDAARTIVIDPGMAFGTGEHATTRGITRLMQRVIRPGDVVADLGAGSAVLAIAAAKLGASRVYAIEIDPDAIENAQENIVRNDVTNVVTIFEGDANALLPLVAPVRIVLANIISSVLLELLPAIANALTPGGQAIVGGILLEERDTFTAAAAAQGWRVETEDAEDIWWSARITR